MWVEVGVEVPVEVWVREEVDVAVGLLIIGEFVEVEEAVAGMEVLVLFEVPVAEEVAVAGTPCSWKKVWLSGST